MSGGGACGMVHETAKAPLILAVFAHPDDESFGVAGTLARYLAEGKRAALICATRGEAGQANGLAGSPEELGALRTGELECAARSIGIDELHVLDWPDGGAATWDMDRLAGQIGDLIRVMNPEAVITFDEEGVTRHPDHIAVHHATLQALRDAPDRLGVRRLYYLVVTCAEEASPEGPEMACIPLDAVDVTMDVRAFEAAKRRALACHRTQAADTHRMLDQPEGSLAAEHYRLAWDTRGWQPPAGADDLLAGL
jgi:LmbE family N-acetylglucosaminyl deacetylase